MTPSNSTTPEERLREFASLLGDSRYNFAHPQREADILAVLDKLEEATQNHSTQYGIAKHLQSKLEQKETQESFLQVRHDYESKLSTAEAERDAATKKAKSHEEELEQGHQIRQSLQSALNEARAEIEGLKADKTAWDTSYENQINRILIERDNSLSQAAVMRDFLALTFENSIRGVRLEGGGEYDYCPWCCSDNEDGGELSHHADCKYSKYKALALSPEPPPMLEQVNRELNNCKSAFYAECNNANQYRDERNIAISSLSEAKVEAKKLRALINLSTRLLNAIKSLSVMDGKKTYFELSPQNNNECFLRWRELNDAASSLHHAIAEDTKQET